MSDSTAFIAGCATTGAAALMLLLARMSLEEAPGGFQEPDFSPQAEAIAPVPLPPPLEGGVSQIDDVKEDLEQSLERQQLVTQRLEDRLEQQEALISDLEDQLRSQLDESRAIAARLEDYRATTTSLTDRQVRLEGEQQDVGQTQSSLVWVGAGLLLVLLVGGSGIMILLVLWLAQSRNQAPPATNTVIYSPPVPAPPYRYYEYEQELLPPAPMRSATINPPQPYNYPG